MKKYRAAIIGCGKPLEGTDANLQGYRIGYSHGQAYRSHEDVEIVSVADISLENARAFADYFDIPKVYSDYEEMIDEEKPDIVSVCTWPTLHKKMAVYAAKAGVKMIWCEKPMAVGLDEMQEMLQACEDNGARLFVNHQRRYETPYQVTRQMMDDGVLGTIERLEGWVGSGWDLPSWGTHWVDMHRFFMHDVPVEWIVAQAPYTARVRYGHPIEDHMLLQFQFDNGVISFIHLGNHLESAGIRVIGTDGSVSFSDGGANFTVQHRKNAEELFERYVQGKPTISGMNAALRDIIQSYETQGLSEIDGCSGAKTTEVVMGAYLSSVMQEKLTLPLKNRIFNLVRDYGVTKTSRLRD